MDTEAKRKALLAEVSALEKKLGRLRDDMEEVRRIAVRVSQTK